MRKTFKYIALIVLAVLLCVVGYTRITGKKAEADQKPEQPRPVAIALAQRHPLAATLVLSGEFRPFQEVDVHAKVSGYVRQIYVDVGDHVKQGQTIAVLEVPELNAQLQGTDAAVRRSKDGVRRAQSDLNRAKSLHEAAHLDYARLLQASEAKAGLIAQQELDNANAKDQESEAQISAAEAALSEDRNALDVAFANQKEYAAMSDYTRIVAPFSGVITRRNVDTGALVQAGTSSNTQALPLVSVAQNDLFRLTLPVPESAVPLVKEGSTVAVHVGALNRDFAGKVARFADALNTETRTMHTEVDVPNKDGSIVEGMYADVTLTLSQKNDALTVPVQAVSREGDHATVLVLDDHNRIEERLVKLGVEGANEIEVVSGLNPNDRVVIGSRGEFRTGDVVTPKVIAMGREGQS
jgi:RND family efflux transporter MFP subunit